MVARLVWLRWLDVEGNPRERLDKEMGLKGARASGASSRWRGRGHVRVRERGTEVGERWVRA